VKWSAVDAVRKVRISALRLRERALGGEGDERAQLAIVCSDAVEAGADQIDG
jgi:hypothetical protein